MAPSQATSSLTPAVTVERTQLPRLFVRGKSEIRYHAHVNTLIIGKPFRYQGVAVTPIYYLSLVAQRGEGAILEGIFNALVSTNPQDIYIERVGTVVLAQHQPAFGSLGYGVHWNYAQVETPGQDLHAVIESHQLTMYDPIRGASPLQRERRQKKSHNERARKKRGKETIQRSTATRKSFGVLEEMQNRELHPAFMLFVPGNIRPEREDKEAEDVYAARCQERITHYLAEMYFAFLDVRAPWPMVIEWSAYLWQRALERGENIPLQVWGAPVTASAQSDEEESEDEPALLPPVFAQAWFCRPDIPQLWRDLQQARLDGRISDLAPRLPDVTEPVPALS